MSSSLGAWTAFRQRPISHRQSLNSLAVSDPLARSTRFFSRSAAPTVSTAGHLRQELSVRAGPHSTGSPNVGSHAAQAGGDRCTCAGLPEQQPWVLPHQGIFDEEAKEKPIVS